MTTMSEKKAFIKANKGLINMSNSAINSLTSANADAVINSIKAHPEYTEQEPATTASTPALVVADAVASTEFGMLLNLPYVGQTKKGFKFQYGDTFVFCNDGTLFLLADAGKLVVGQEFAFKADTLKTINDSAFFSARLNYSADATILSVNEKIDNFQSAIETKIKIRAKKYGLDYKTAQSQVLALMQAEEDAEFKQSMPKLSI